MPRTYHVYLVSNTKRTVLYCGITNNLRRRIAEHKAGTVPGFTATYRATDLLWCEAFSDVRDAIRREKQIKNWHRPWKWNLIRQANPDLMDLAASLEAEKEEGNAGKADPETSSG